MSELVKLENLSIQLRSEPTTQRSGILQLNLKQLETFIWIANLGSFRRTAERLNTTQPNVSARISALEAVLKVKLMERDAGSVRLTTKGQELLEHARRILRATEDMIEASNNAALFDGVLRLGVTEMVVHTWLRDFLKTLKERFPKIVVELTVDLSVNLEKELFERSIDLALQYGPFKGMTTGSKDLGTYSMIWVASPSIGLHSKANITMADLASYPILTHSRDTQSFIEVTEHFASRHDLSARLVPSSNLAACLHMTMNGMGIATMPEVMVAGELASGELCQIEYEWVPESLRFLARFDAKKSPKYVATAANIANEVATRFIDDFQQKKYTNKKL